MTAQQNIPEGYKQTEVGVIPKEWRIKNLGEIGNFVKGRGISKSEAQNGSIPAIRYGELYTVHHNIIRRFYSFINDNVSCGSQKLHNGDILFAGSGETKEEIGKAAAFINDIEAYAGGDIIIFRQKHNNSVYLGYLMNSEPVRKQKAQKGQGDAVVHIYINTVSNIKLPLPPKPEQAAIARALSDMDALIEAQEKLIAKKRFIKQGTMQELLKPKKHWVKKRLGDVAKVVGGGTPSSFNHNYWNGDINWFTPTEIGNVKYAVESNRKISKEGYINSSANLLTIGSILLTSRAAIGDLAILKVEACTNQGFQSLIPLKGINNEFLYYLVSTKKDKLFQNASGSTFLEISPQKVKQIEISLPDAREQDSISTILSLIDIEIEKLEKKLSKYRKIKEGMMQELLTGKTRLI